MTSFAVTTFGCQMNSHDSERMEEVLRAHGCRRADPTEADVIVLNTCSVREKAEQKLRSEVGRLARLKRQRPGRVLVVAGCMAQQEGQRIVDRMPAVDLVIGPDNIAELPELLAELSLGAPPIVRTVFDLDAPRFLTAPSVGAGRPTAYVTTMKGCDERCSFCVVPHTRGPERYRPSDDIVAEIAEVVSRGVREVTLLGQTVNSYRDPLDKLATKREQARGESEFAALLRRICEAVPGLLRLRYTSPHPRHLTASLIEAHRDLPRLPRHLHLPVQSGSDRVLKRMIRRTTRADYLGRIARLRAAVPDVTLSTDIIVGFCGETEADFAQTLELVEQVGFAGVFGFKYSARPHTPARRLPDDVPEAVKTERLARLFAVSERLLQRHLTAQVGRTVFVLVEGPSRSRPNNATGRSERNEIVHIEGAGPRASELIGSIRSVEVVEAFKHSLLGRLVEPLSASDVPRAAAARRSLPVLQPPVA